MWLTGGTSVNPVNASNISSEERDMCDIHVVPGDTIVAIHETFQTLYAGVGQLNPLIYAIDDEIVTAAFERLQFEVSLGIRKIRVQLGIPYSLDENIDATQCAPIPGEGPDTTWF